MKRYQKILLLLVSIFVVSGCTTPAPNEEVKKIDPSLENVREIKFISDIKTVAFEWKPLKDTKVVGVNVYRGEQEESLSKVGETSTRYATHYVDSELEANSNYIYRFATYTKEGLESNPSEVVEVKTRDVMGPITFIEAIGNLPEQIKLIFKPHGDFRVNGYIIQRRMPTEPEWIDVAKIQGRLNAEFIDAELKHGQVYEYRIMGTTYEGFNTHVSKTVNAKTRKLPPIVRGVDATTTLPKKVKISWNKVSNNININYNVYRSSSLEGGYELVKKNWDKSSIIDNVNDDGIVYFYKITSVDAYGLESPRQEIGVKGNSLERPLPPVIIYSSIDNGTAVIKWEKRDERNDTFIVQRDYKTGMFKGGSDKTEPKIDLEHRDSGLQKGGSYTYSVIAVDEFGIESEPSEAVTLTYAKDAKK